jgi:tetratricopeptide (TPR) repeat protein
MKSIDKYLFQAIDNYPYWLENAIEGLDYALSYDDKNSNALCLYGRVLAEQLHDFEQAKSYYQSAIAENINAVQVYPYYIQTLLWNEDFEEAEKLIDFALTIKGMNRVEVLSKKVILLELKKEFKAAKKQLKEMKLAVINSDYSTFIDEAETRLKAKLKLVSDAKEKTKDKKSKGKKSKKKSSN